MDKKQIKNKLIKECENQIAEREARILEHKKIYDEAVAKEQEQIEVFKIQLESYKKYVPV